MWVLRLYVNLVLLLLTVVRVLVGVAFFTLFERKLLGYIQLRKGPNKVGVTGVIQPFADAIKLFSKEHIVPLFSNYSSFIVAPVLALSIGLIIWIRVPSSFNIFSFDLSVMFFLRCIGVGVYRVLMAGWRSCSKYSLFGALRGVAQTISYEVSLVLIILSPLFLVSGYEWALFGRVQRGGWLLFVLPWSALVWFISCLAETNRTPFDFAEGESELVSGYNTEYRRGGFALIILAEYARILLMSFLFVYIFIGGFRDFFSFLNVLMLAFLFVWVRGTLPRFRYDKLIYLAWKSFLPFSLFFLFMLGGCMWIFLGENIKRFKLLFFVFKTNALD